jgi:alpha-ketoglutarate-dependent taurine dioxygenase
MTGFEINPLPGARFGAEIVGLAAPHIDDESSAARLRRAFADRSLLIFRAIDFDPAQHIAFGRLFGPINVPAGDGSDALPGHREIFVVSNISREGQPLGAYNEEDVWHCDHAYRRVPSHASLFLARQVPQLAGWETGFADSQAAVADMKESWLDRLLGARVLHDHEDYMRRYYPDLPYPEADRLLYPPLSHPALSLHPVTRRVGLNFSASTMAGVVDADGVAFSRDFIATLIEFVTQPRYCYFHQYRAGDMILWDNRGLWHKPPPPRGLFDAGDPNARLFHRVTISGEAPPEAARAADLDAIRQPA